MRFIAKFIAKKANIKTKSAISVKKVVVIKI